MTSRDTLAQRVSALEATSADHEERITALEGAAPPDPPEPPEPFVPDPFVIDQIARNAQAQVSAFKIINDLIPTPGAKHVNLWTAPYIFDLGNGFGWVPGDRAGYQPGAYMFLGDINPASRYFGRLTHRVYFTVPQSEGAAYGFINDKYMDEIQTTHLTFHGTGDPDARQDQAPGARGEYAPLSDPVEVRPLIILTVDGVAVENRSYTNTVTPGLSVVRFQDLGYDPTTRTVKSGTGVDGKVYATQTVAAYVDRGASWLPSHAVYYDVIHPAGGITR